MRKLITLLFLAALALPALADDGYKFHLKVTDARAGLLANPRFAELHVSDEQLEAARKDRVMVFDHVSGAHWVWLMLSWLETKPDAEQRINSRGAASKGEADLGLVPLSYTTIRTRCLREQCNIRVTAADGKQTAVTLHKEETAELPLDADFDATFAQ